jgi:hypothetical protein
MKKIGWLSRLLIPVPESPLHATIALEPAQPSAVAKELSLPTLLGVVVAAILLFVAAIGAWGQSTTEFRSVTPIAHHSPASPLR